MAALLAVHVVTLAEHLQVGAYHLPGLDSGAPRPQRLSQMPLPLFSGAFCIAGAGSSVAAFGDDHGCARRFAIAEFVVVIALRLEAIISGVGFNTNPAKGHGIARGLQICLRGRRPASDSRCNNDQTNMCLGDHVSSPT